MKKKFKLLISAILVAAVFFTMAPAALAAEATVTAPVKNIGTEAYAAKSITYTQAKKLDNYDAGVIIPIKVTKAGVIEVKFSFSKLEKAMKAELYTDAKCSNSLSGSPSMYGYFQPGNTGESCFAGVSNAGTYYLKLSSSAYSSDSSFKNQVNLGIALWPSGDHTIKSGQTITNYNQGSVTNWDYKFTATKNGKITLTHNSTSGYDAQILNAKKKPLSDTQWCSNGVKRTNCQFAVEKGKTYYIRINPNDSTTKLHKLTLKETAVKEKSGKSRAKAVTLKAKKKANGTIAPGSKKADWYKINNKKKKKLIITITGQASTYLTVTVYDKKGKKVGDFNTYAAYGAEGKVTYGSTYGKANKGTYYIKVSRKSSKDSGVYTLKWK